MRTTHTNHDAYYKAGGNCLTPKPKDLIQIDDAMQLTFEDLEQNQKEKSNRLSKELRMAFDLLGDLA